eukprot:SAG11_NODE_6518_length_1297_cov_1.890651_2_plen_184_part_00
MMRTLCECAAHISASLSDHAMVVTWDQSRFATASSPTVCERADALGWRRPYGGKPQRCSVAVHLATRGKIEAKRTHKAEDFLGVLRGDGIAERDLGARARARAGSEGSIVAVEGQPHRFGEATVDADRQNSQLAQDESGGDAAHCGDADRAHCGDADHVVHVGVARSRLVGLAIAQTSIPLRP